ncbi:MAG TPA: hypothetical protein VFM47_07240 [Gaiellales bacterium]|nr:hypothetical protein [Gaiellales bacterium]
MIQVVEDVTGGSLLALLDKDPVAAERPMEILAGWLAAMADVRSASFGKVAFVDAGGRSAGTCASAMLDRALAELQEIAGRDKRAADAQERLGETLHALAEPIEPRAAAALIHGELGPDHVLLDRRGGSRAPATPNANGSAAWPSVTSSASCTIRRRLSE